MIPIGRGQRQPSSATANRQDRHYIDAIINQKVNWASRPQEAGALHLRGCRTEGSTIAALGRPSRTPVRWSTLRSCTPASDLPASVHRAAIRSAIGQHWMYQGKHVLIIFDDLPSRPRHTVRCR